MVLKNYLIGAFIEWLNYLQVLIGRPETLLQDLFGSNH